MSKLHLNIHHISATLHMQVFSAPTAGCSMSMTSKSHLRHALPAPAKAGGTRQHVTSALPLSKGSHSQSVFMTFQWVCLSTDSAAQASRNDPVLLDSVAEELLQVAGAFDTVATRATTHCQCALVLVPWGMAISKMQAQLSVSGYCYCTGTR